MSDEASGKSWQGELDGLLFLLERYDYRYQDIIQGKASALVAETAISDQFTTLLRMLAKNQKKRLERILLNVAAKPIVNFFNYSYSRNTLWLSSGFGGIDFGWSHQIWRYGFAERANYDLFGYIDKGTKKITATINSILKCSLFLNLLVVQG